jgi:hypothetical protein
MPARKVQSEPEPPVAAFQRALAPHLRALSPRLTRVLKKLITHPYPVDFWQLDFEIFGLYGGFPVRSYFYRKGFDQVFEGMKGAKAYPFTVPPHLLKVRRMYPAAIDRKFGIDAAEDTWHDDAAAEIILPWFHRCWKAAGGAKFPYRATIASHDSRRRFDLVKGK